MELAALKKLALFYARFTPSYSKIGYFARGLFIRQYAREYANQTWLVTGASGGIGAAIVKEGALGGANVIAVARNEEKLIDLKRNMGTLADRVDYVVADMSTVGGVKALTSELRTSTTQYDVLFNNVGVLFNEIQINPEGQETTFVTNLLSHYYLTENLVSANYLKRGAAVINMTSGGMYNAPLGLGNLHITDPDKYEGKAVYGAQKRAQVVLTSHWNQKFDDRDVAFYVMHPGWAKTDGVKSALPTFYKLQNIILRSPYQGAETAFWLAATRPEVSENPDHGVWFDHKLHPAHIFEATVRPTCSVENLVDFLEREMGSMG